jgi:hypothetical protein
MSYNLLYLAYCKYHKNGPVEQLQKDTIKWPGGKMCGYILWISKMKRKFWKVRPEAFYDQSTIYDLKAWVSFVVNYK